MASDDFNWMQACMAPVHMTDSERALRDLFVDEYLVDYDPKAAALRCGFHGNLAEDYAKKFMEEPYVNKRLQDLQLLEPKDDNAAGTEEKIHKRKIVMALMREAHNRFNSGSARVAALAKLMAHYGMDTPAREHDDIVNRGGVMQVPAIADIGAWEQAATSSQTRLVLEARSEVA